MRHLRTLFASAVLALSLALVFAMAQDTPPKATSTIEVTDVRGTKHVVMDYGNGSRFFRAGLPFDDNITDDYPKNGKGFWDRAKSLKTAIAVELHTPEDQAKIRKAALGRGMRDSELDHTHTVLLIPLPSLDSITFSQQKAGQDEGQARSEVRLAGGQSFTAGGGFWKLYGKENLGSLGTANFSADLSDVKSIRSLAPPMPFVGDFGFFGATEVPFSAKVTDTAGEVTVLKKALYCTTGTFNVPNNRNTGFVTYGDVGVSTVTFKSSLDVKVGGTSSMSIPPSKLRTISVGNVDKANGWGGYDAKAMLRTGENVDLTIVPSQGIYVPNGIVGASPKGWVWIPWYAVASIEFTDN
jgi:hypothetical protein